MDPKSTGTEDERFCLVHFGTISVRSFGLYNAPLTLENQNWRSGMSGMCLVCNSVFAVAAAPKIVGSGPRNNHRCHSPVVTSNDFSGGDSPRPPNKVGLDCFYPEARWHGHGLWYPRCVASSSNSVSGNSNWASRAGAWVLQGGCEQLP